MILKEGTDNDQLPNPEILYHIQLSNIPKVKVCKQLFACVILEDNRMFHFGKGTFPTVLFGTILLNNRRWNDFLFSRSVCSFVFLV